MWISLKVWFGVLCPLPLSLSLSHAIPYTLRLAFIHDFNEMGYRNDELNHSERCQKETHINQWNTGDT